MKDNKNNKAKIYMIFSLVVLVIVAIVSGTYAYYVWTTSDSDTTKIVAGVGAATVTFDGGSDISANLRPVSDKSKGIVKNINVKANSSYDVKPTQVVHKKIEHKAVTQETKVVSKKSDDNEWESF